MMVPRWWWRGALVGGVLALTLPLWLGSGRADPLFLMPLLGLATAACVSPHMGFRRWTRAIGLALFCGAILVLGGAWLASGVLPFAQIAILIAASALLALLHQLLARPRARFVRLLLHGLLALLWVPAGLALADAAYRAMPAPDRPRVLLLTSLPLVWGEGSGNVLAALDDEAAPAPIYTHLSARTRLRAVDGIMSADLAATDVLLLIQPRALPPATLVDIDAWVRGGGKLLWLADPNLAGEMPFALGDPRNPEPTEPNLALLGLWGLELGSADAAGEGAGIAAITVDMLPLRLRAPGRLTNAGDTCLLALAATLADCRIGRGRAIILADADMVDAALWGGEEGAGPSPFLWHSANAEWLEARIAGLADATSAQPWARPVWLRPAFRR